MDGRPSLPQIEAPISRRRLLRAGVAAAALAALAGCGRSAGATDGSHKRRSVRLPSRTDDQSAAPSTMAGQNVAISNSTYGEHVGPSVAVNPRNPPASRRLPGFAPATPERIVTYLSVDAGASWAERWPAAAAGGRPAGDDVTVAFDAYGRGYICATRSGHGSHLNPGNPNASRAVYVWRTDDGGRSFSAPVTVVAGQYCDHPWLATGQGQAPGGPDIYVAWGAGDSHTALDFGALQRWRAELRAAAQDPAGGHHPLAGERRPPARRRAAWPGVRRLRLDNQAGPVRGHDRPGGGGLLDRCGTELCRTGRAGLGIGGHRAARRRQAQQRPGGRGLAPGRCPLRRVSPHQPGATHADIVVTASHDRGRTWSRAVQATPGDGVIYFQPNLAVDAAGRVAISAFALANGRLDEVLLLSRPRELRFGPPLRVTTAPFDPLNPTTASRGNMAPGGSATGRGSPAAPGPSISCGTTPARGNLDLFAATVRTCRVSQHPPN